MPQNDVYEKDTELLVEAPPGLRVRYEQYCCVASENVRKNVDFRLFPQRSDQYWPNRKPESRR